jgi:hypothetical protein
VVAAVVVVVVIVVVVAVAHIAGTLKAQSLVAAYL